MKALNPNITLVFYYNANLDLPDYRLYNVTAQHAPKWWVRNSSGSVLIVPLDHGAGANPPFPYGKGVPVYDFTVAQVRDAWVQECFDMVSASGGFDGCMVDRWSKSPFPLKPYPGYPTPVVLAWKNARSHATNTLASRAQNESVYLVGEGDAVSAVSDPGYGYGGISALERQMDLARRGQGLLASYRPTTTGDVWTSQLAMFLIGAGQGHYFGAGSWTCDHIHREGVTWHPEYDQPLGAPLGNATKHGDVWMRNFSFGTNVTYDTKSGRGTIAWGVFP